MRRTGEQREGEQEDQKIRKIFLRVFFLLIFLLTLSLSGCQTHLCDATSSTVDDSDGGPVPLHRSPGMVVWESAPFEGPWLDFPGEATITFELPAGLGWPDEIDPVVSTGPYQDSGTWTLGADQVVEGTNPDSHTIALTNATCAEYYLRVEVKWYVDAGVPTDAGRD